MQVTKICICIVKTVKITSVTGFQKNSLDIKETKGKSKSAICLIQRTFIRETQEKYGLESKLEIYLQFFTY